MRRHGVLKNTSSQSLCLFCAFRLSQVAPATAAQRRLVHHTRRANQQATTQATQPTSAPPTPHWTFDANSSLSPSEQRWKAERIKKREKAAEEAAAESTRLEEEAQARQIRELQAREAEGKAEREEQERRLDAQNQHRSARGQQASQRPDNRTRESRQAQRPQQHASRKQEGAWQRRSNFGDNVGAAAAPTPIARRPDRDHRASRQLFDRPQVQQSTASNVIDAGRDRRAPPSPFDTPQVPQVKSARPQRTENRQRAPTPRNAAKGLARPTFGGSQQSEEAPTGWGMGQMQIKPLRHKTDEEIEQDSIAEQEKVKQEKIAAAETAKEEDRERQERQRQIAAERKQEMAEREKAVVESQRAWSAQRVSKKDRGKQSNAYHAPLPPNKPLYDFEGEYQATPFRSMDYQQPSTPTPDQAWANTWHHLAPRKSEQSRAPSPPPQQAADARHQPYRLPMDGRIIDENFEEHRRIRNASIPELFSNPNIQNRPPPQQTSRILRQEIRCFRCQEYGHHARECLNPMKCAKCGGIGHHEKKCGQRPAKQERPESRHDAFSEDRGAQGEPGNIFRKTQVGSSEESAGSEEQPQHYSYRPIQNSPRTSGAQKFGSLRSQPTESEAEREDKKKFEPTVARGWIDGEDEPEQDNSYDRRARRRSRGFADEEVEDEQPASKSFERRKEARSSRRREVDEDEDDEALAAREERAAKKAQRKAQGKADQDKRKAARAAGDRVGGGTQVMLPEFVSVSNLAQQLGVGYEPFVERLEQLGYDDVFPGKVLNRETSGMIAMEYDFDPIHEGPGSAKSEEEERDLKAAPEVEDTTFLPTRPPVVTIMGHVDHGKTTILDYLRRTFVAAGEAGGITQHIGAFSVPLSASGRTITFLDTPGHAAFMSMRQRGANVTDIVILVVAADDSVKPQTLESIRCAREAGVPMIVAVNKVDKPEADVQRVKNDLGRHGVEIEDFGGEVQVVEVSGKTGQGLDALEENVVTLSEILDHRSDTDGAVEGWVLEATTKRAGRVATVLVKRGTLRPGAILVAGKTWARVRSLRDERDKSLMEVGPGMPVEVDGWADQPVAGDQVLQAPGEQKAKDVVVYRQEKGERVKMEEDMEAINESRRLEQERRKAAEKAAKAAAAATEAGEDGTDAAKANAAVAAAHSSDPAQEPTGQQTIPFIIKADVSGSAEAIAAYIPSLTSPLIAPDILSSTVGAINESDIELASASGGHIVAFNLPKNEDMRGLAEGKGVQVLENNIIYRVLEQVREVLEARLPEILTHRVVGEADVGVVFEISVGGRKKLKIAGCKIRNGAVARNARVRVVREGEKVYDGTITSLKNVKKDVPEMRKGTECGMGFEGWEDFKEGDQVQTYEEVREKRKL